MRVTKVRNYSKRGDALPIPNLVEVQQAAYERFLQLDKSFDERDEMTGLEALLREVFPIVSYDESMRLEYLYYKLDEPRYTPDECRHLRLTYGMPFRIGVRLVREDVKEMPEEEIYLGEIPIIMGGGEFIVNGAERVIVNQLHRSPGVDFSVASLESDRPLHSARIIPERGSWIEIEVTKKDVLAMRIDQSTKIAATTFLRAIEEKLSTTDALIKEYYDVSELAVGKLKPEHYAAATIVDTETGEELVKAGAQIGDAIGQIQASSIASGSARGIDFEAIRATLKNSRKLEMTLDEVNAFRQTYFTKTPGFEFTWLRTDLDPVSGEVRDPLSAKDLGAVEARLIAEHGGSSDHPRLNDSPGSVRPENPELVDSLVAAANKIVSAKDEWVVVEGSLKDLTDTDQWPHLIWEGGPEAQSQKELESGPQGIYFLRPRKGQLCDGYIGLAGKEKAKGLEKPGLAQRLKEHLWTGDYGRSEKGKGGTDQPFIRSIVADAVYRKMQEGATVDEAVEAMRLPGNASEVVLSAKRKLSGEPRGNGKVLVITDPSDPLVLNTIAAEQIDQFLEGGVAENEHEAALLRIYGRLRPGNPPQVDKARALFEEKFFDENRYRIGKVGRFRINRKFDIDLPEEEMRLRSEDFLYTIRYILDLRSNRNKAHTDDIDHLGNRRLRTLDELAVEEMRKGFLKLRRTVQERMSVKDPDELSKIADLINSKSISSSIDFFFGRGELSQVVDQTNPLSQLTHERRLSALGPGGLNRKRAGFEVRDVHISHYGRICPIETPEGTNIGLIASLGIYSKIDDYGFLLTPYQVVDNGGVSKKTQYLRADEEMKSILAPSDMVDENGKLQKGNVLARVDGELAQVDSKEVQFIDISPKQIVGVSAALIPFLEHDDANRALMGSNMQRQAVPMVITTPPIVATGMEKEVPKNSGMVVRARNAGTVTAVDGRHIIIDNADEYVLRKFHGLNEKTCLNQKPIVQLGQKVKAGQIIADGPATYNGELALGKNALVAFNTFDGYNFEDAIVMNERIVKEDVFTSLHIESFDVEIRETKLGREEFTRDIPNVSEKQLSNLDEYGVIQIGTHVRPNDILVGKVSPKSKSELTPEEKLLHAIFGRAGEDVKNDSLEVPAGTEGVVIATQRFSRRMHMSDDQKKQLKKDMKAYEQSMDEKAMQLFRQMVDQINEVTGTPMIDPTTRQKVGASDIVEVVMEQVENFDMKWIKGSKAAQQQAEQIYNQFWPRINAIEAEKQRKLAHMKRGDELPSGVLEMVKVWLCTKRTLSVGDKFAGRHGNKGVVARIVPEEDMPFLEDGTTVDVLLNPLGVPSRMNVGQILETHLGWACRVLGFQAVTPVFDGCTEAEVHEAIEEANQHVRDRIKELDETNQAPHHKEILVEMPRGGKVQLHDGRTGEPFDQRTTVGIMYLLKLHHLVDDKIHARATGPYSLITQQPLGGKARTGGQRFGEMEVWALEAYGAAYVLQELLTVKSDDVEGRTKIYESMVKGTNSLEAGMPVAFDVLCNEIKGLGLNISLEKRELEGGSLL